MIPVAMSSDGRSFLVGAGPRHTDTMKQISGARHDPKNGVWVMPAFLAQAHALGSLLRGQLTYGEDVRERLMLLVDWQLAQLRTKEGPRLDWSDSPLYQFQQIGVEFICNSRRTILADDMGTGKTVQALISLAEVDAFPALVVCTNSMKFKWADEVRNWLGEDVIPYVVDGTKPKREKIIAEAAASDESGHPVVVIVNYETLWRHSALAPFGSTALSDKEKVEGSLNQIRWQAVVADEAHKIKEPKAKQTRAVWYASRSARVRLALTGTPIVNSPDDLWSIGRFVCPEEFGLSRSRWRDRYCIMQPGIHGGVENLGLRPDRRAELDAWLQPRFLRRTKEEVLPQLPSKVRTTLKVQMTTKQAKAYKALKDEMIARLDDGSLILATDGLGLSIRLRQVASAMPVVEDGAVTALTAPSCKVDALLDLLEDGAAPVVVYAESRKLIELAAAEVEKRGYRVGLITGLVPTDERAVVVAEFQAGNLDVVLGTTGAAAEGVTLTRASTLIFLQRSWSNVANRQAEDRVHRIGQEASSVNIITLVTEDTIDEAVENTVNEKEGRFQELVRDPEWLRANA